MPEIDELDRHSIGKALRRRLYLGNFTGAVSIGIILTWFLINCQKEKDELRDLYDARRESQFKEMERRFYERYGPAIRDVKQDIEATTQTLDSLKNLTR
jgi:patatin-like phospholipase/acyl hydrolase